jgi:hypothetical protein
MANPAKRFENKRLIMLEHGMTILNSPPLIKNSQVAMSQLLDNITINIEALRTLGQEVDKWDALIVPIIITLKFDFVTKRDWESTLDCELPKLADLVTFLNKKKHFVRVINAQQKTVNTNVYNASEIDEGKGPLQCFMCKKNHSLYQCIEFLNLPIVERITRVKSLNLCANCLKRNHNAAKCKASSCRQCNGKQKSQKSIPFNQLCPM